MDNPIKASSQWFKCKKGYIIKNNLIKPNIPANTIKEVSKITGKYLEATYNRQKKIMPKINNLFQEYFQFYKPAGLDNDGPGADVMITEFLNIRNAENKKDKIMEFANYYGLLNLDFKSSNTPQLFSKQLINPQKYAEKIDELPYQLKAFFYWEYVGPETNKYSFLGKLNSFYHFYNSVEKNKTSIWANNLNSQAVFEHNSKTNSWEIDWKFNSLYQFLKLRLMLNKVQNKKIQRCYDCGNWFSPEKNRGGQRKRCYLCRSKDNYHQDIRRNKIRFNNFLKEKYKNINSLLDKWEMDNSEWKNDTIPHPLRIIEEGYKINSAAKNDILNFIKYLKNNPRIKLKYYWNIVQENIIYQ